MISLKVTKNQGFTLCLEDTIFEKPQGRGETGVKLSTPPSSAVVGLIFIELISERPNLEYDFVLREKFPKASTLFC